MFVLYSSFLTQNSEIYIQNTYFFQKTGIKKSADICNQSEVRENLIIWDILFL